MATLGEEPRSSSSGRIQFRAYVEIELENGEFIRRAFVDQHTVIGRSPTLPLSLDHDTVSRRHAELFCDPFGRWWIRDLGSTNGTSVNGDNVTERVLRPGDRIGIGDYRLQFHLGLSSDGGLDRRKRSAPALAAANTSDRPEDSDAASSWIKSLRDIETPRISASHLSQLMAMSRKLITIEDATARLNTLCELVVSHDFHGAAAMVLRLAPGEATQVVAGPIRPGNIDPGEPPYVSRGVLKEVLQTGEPAIASNLAVPAGSLELTISAEIAPLAAVACPIAREGEAMDVLYVNLPPQYGRAEWLALLALSAEAHQQAEVAWAARKHAQEHAAIERELATARQIQRALIPKQRTYEGLDVAVGFEPCKWVGGDYVDAVELSDGRILLTVADVCGKGLQAALVTFSLHTMVRTLADSAHEIVDLMEKVNVHLGEYMLEDSFVTMTCLTLDPQTGEIECVNAGHPPAFVFRPDGSVRALQAGENPAIGIGTCAMLSEKSRIEPGETLLLYTDGLTELRNISREMFGEDQLKDLLRGLAQAHERDPLSSTANGLARSLDAFRGDQVPEDDRAFLLARRLGPG